MNEFFVLLDTVRGIAYVAFGATFLLAAGLAIFSGRSAAPARDDAKAVPERHAA